MLHVRIRTADHQILTESEPDQLSELARDQANLIWVDLDTPTPDEISLVASILNWTHFTVEDLISLDERAKIETFEDYSVIVMHDFTYTGEPKRLQTPEVDFVVEIDRGATLGIGFWLQSLLTLEGLDLLHSDLELVGDPGVGAALTDPGANPVQLGSERSTGHRAETNTAAGCQDRSNTPG